MKPFYSDPSLIMNSFTLIRWTLWNIYNRYDIKSLDILILYKICAKVRSGSPVQLDGSFCFNRGSLYHAIVQYCTDYETVIQNLRHLQYHINSCAFFCRCSNFLLPVNWHDHNNRDITRTKTFKIIWVYAHWSKHPTDQSHSITSGLFPVLSDVENLIHKKFYCTKRFAIKFQGESLERFFTYDSI